MCQVLHLGLAYYASSTCDLASHGVIQNRYWVLVREPFLLHPDDIQVGLAWVLLARGTSALACEPFLVQVTCGTHANTSAVWYLCQYYRKIIEKTWVVQVVYYLPWGLHHTKMAFLLTTFHYQDTSCDWYHSGLGVSFKSSNLVTWRLGIIENSNLISQQRETVLKNFCTMVQVGLDFLHYAKSRAKLSWMFDRYELSS